MLHVIYGKDPYSMTREILEKMSPERGLKRDSLVALKPNLVVAKPSSSGATTSPDIARGVLEHFQSRGFANLLIMESSWVGDSTQKAFEVCGYRELARELKIGLLDLKNDRGVKRKGRNMALTLCQKALEVDYLVNLPVLKAHCQTRLTCALKNLKGLVPDGEKRRFHSLGLHGPIAELNLLLKTGLVLVDAIMGDLTYEEGGNPVEMGRIIGGTDPVLVDSYAAGLIGLGVEEVPYILKARELGIGHLYSAETPVQEYRRENYPPLTLAASPRVKRLAGHVVEGSACSPCYGALIHALSRLEERGRLGKVRGKIYIGRDFRDKVKERGTDPGPAPLGIGSCTACLGRYLPGCPPETRSIIEFLEGCYS